MGSDKGKVIHRYRRLKRKYIRRKKYPSSKLLHSGDGIIKKSFRDIGPKSFVNKAKYLTPTNEM